MYLSYQNDEELETLLVSIADRKKRKGKLVKPPGVKPLWAFLLIVMMCLAAIVVYRKLSSITYSKNHSIIDIHTRSNLDFLEESIFTQTIGEWTYEVKFFDYVSKYDSVDVNHWTYLGRFTSFDGETFFLGKKGEVILNCSTEFEDYNMSVSSDNMGYTKVCITGKEVCPPPLWRAPGENEAKSNRNFFD